MPPTGVPGCRGYDSNPGQFIASSQALDFFEVCQDFVAYLPPVPARILDAGAGAGQNAAALAQMGYAVVAVEPMTAFLTAARTAYPGLPVTWLKGSLPRLDCLPPATASFDFILVDGVWHHLSAQERGAAIARFSGLLPPGGRCALSLRHGPPGLGTRVYPTDIHRAIAQGEQWGFKPRFQVDNQPSLFSHKPDVTWGRLVLEKQY